MATDGQTHTALTEFVIDGAVYFLDQRLTRERLELLLICGGDLTCFEGARAVNDIRIKSLKKTAYLEFLKSALGVHDVEGAKYVYQLAKTAGAGGACEMTLTVMIKVAHGEGDGGGILLKGVEVVLAAVPASERCHVVGSCLRRRAIASHSALATLTEYHAAEGDLAAYKTLCDTSVARAADSEALMLEATLRVVNEKKRKIQELTDAAARHEKHTANLQHALRIKEEEHRDLLSAHHALRQELAAMQARVARADVAPAPPPPPQQQQPQLVPNPNPNDPSLDSYPDFTTVQGVRGAVVPASRGAAGGGAGGSGSALARAPTAVSASPPQRQRTRGLSQVAEEEGAGPAAKRRRSGGAGRTNIASARALLDSD